MIKAFILPRRIIKPFQATPIFKTSHLKSNISFVHYNITERFEIFDSNMTEEINTFAPKNRKEWREWLEKNHNKEEKVWVIMSKKSSSTKTIHYPEVVEECLCFGWIDSRAKRIDDERWMQLITRRKDNSVWSAVNKKRVTSLIEQGLIAEPGMEKIKRAKENGSWASLDNVEAIIIPEDLKKVSNKHLW